MKLIFGGGGVDRLSRLDLCYSCDFFFLAVDADASLAAPHPSVDSRGRNPTGETLLLLLLSHL